MSVKVTLSLFFALLAFANSASFLDYLDWDDEKTIEVPELHKDEPNRNCTCEGPACVCCVNFNKAFIDLVDFSYLHPGCVDMKYVSQEDGYLVNVSYGKALIRISKLQGENAAPICLEVFGKFAQVCAKFSDLATTSNGLQGCLKLEPSLVGEAHLDFPIGCFKHTADGMVMEDIPQKPEETTVENTPADSNIFNGQSFLLNIFETAKLSVSFIKDILDIPPKSNESTTIKPSTSPTQDNTQIRAPKFVKHPNQL